MSLEATIDLGNGMVGTKSLLFNISIIEPPVEYNQAPFLGNSSFGLFPNKLTIYTDEVFYLQVPETIDLNEDNTSLTIDLGSAKTFVSVIADKNRLKIDTFQ